MPLTRISIPSHLPLERAHALADATHQALVATCAVPMEDRFQLITSFAPGTMLMHPTFPNVQRSADACVVEICFLAGRTGPQKRALYQHVAAGAAQAGFVPDDIMIALVENETIDWSLGRGQTYAEMHTN